jgi:hypothetical protein
MKPTKRHLQVCIASRAQMEPPGESNKNSAMNNYRINVNLRWLRWDQTSKKNQNTGQLKWGKISKYLN